MSSTTSSATTTPAAASAPHRVARVAGALRRKLRAARFELVVGAHVAAILVLCAAIGWLLAAGSYYATALLLTAVLSLLIASLCKAVRRTNRELERFLLAVRHDDFAQTFSAPGAQGAFTELEAAFDGVMRRFRDARAAEAAQSTYLETLVRHVPVAVVAWDQAGRIDLCNDAARTLLGIASLANRRELDRLRRGLAADLDALEPGESRLIQAVKHGEPLRLRAAAARLRIGERDLRIVTLQDIRPELEAHELAAWQNLIRVLTHEIMNSVTPISSLAATAADLLTTAAEEPGNAPPDIQSDDRPSNDRQRDDRPIDDARDAVETIRSRSDALLRFVDSYRRLSRLPTPVVRPTKLRELVDRVEQLMRAELDHRGIVLSLKVPRPLAITADPDLLEQCLINLIRNAIDALDGINAPRIEVAAQIGDRDRIVLSVADNGRGMDEATRENAFVPFFTTKREGSGIGLSLVRQVMSAHGGAANLHSIPGRGTSVRLVF